jgi:broad specificity phosphatase PhoE
LPGCETLQQVQNRAVKGVLRLLEQHSSENLLLVSHLIVLRCLVLYFQRFEIKDFRSVKIDNGSILQLSEVDKNMMSVNFL